MILILYQLTIQYLAINKRSYSYSYSYLLAYNCDIEYVTHCICTVHTLLQTMSYTYIQKIFQCDFKNRRTSHRWANEALLMNPHRQNRFWIDFGSAKSSIFAMPPPQAWIRTLLLGLCCLAACSIIALLKTGLAQQPIRFYWISDSNGPTQEGIDVSLIIIFYIYQTFQDLGCKAAKVKRLLQLHNYQVVKLQRLQNW